MPRSKHRRKPGGKAVAHPGRRTPEKLDIDWPEQQRMRLTGVSDLPLWRASEAFERQWDRDLQAVFEHFAPDRLPPELIAEYKALQAEHARHADGALDLPSEQEQRLIELEHTIATAIPAGEVLDYLAAYFGYGTSERPLPAEVYWNTNEVT
jgi:hypothetical protein